MIERQEKMSKTEYKVCHSWSIAEVERQVNEAIKDGYFPIGGIAFDGKEDDRQCGLPTVDRSLVESSTGGVMMEDKNMEPIDYAAYAAAWKDFFISKGFTLHYADECGGIFQSFRGCQPQLRADVYAGKYRNNTETGGCICVDFSTLFDKVSKCPIYLDLNESPETVWKAIEMLMDAGKDFSSNFGRIIKQRGGLEYSPDIHNIKIKTECRRNKKK